MKSSFYFPHDYHSRHDPRLEHLRMEVGPASDGIFWDIVEMMYEEGGYLNIKDIPIYARMLNANEHMFNEVVNKMFISDGDRFYSNSVLRRLAHINNVIEQRRFAGKASGKARQTNICSTNAEHTLNNINKVNKVNKIKEKNTVPTLTDADFIKTLKDNPVYDRIDIDAELGKMDSWLLANPRRQKTRKFVVAWLNRIERPMKPALHPYEVI